MKRTFHITHDSAAAPGDVLLCEFSQHHVCTAVADGASKAIQQLSYYELKSGLLPETIHNILEGEGLAPGTIKRVVLNNALKEAVLVPAQHFAPDSAPQFYASVNGDDNVLHFDDVQAYNLVVVHGVPQALIQEWKNIGETKVTHFYTCQLQSGDNATADETIAVHFTGKEIRVVAKKEGQLKLAQTYFYTAPLDVVYYLLAICQQYGFSQANTDLLLSGLVSHDSAMYKELYQYFSNLHFWNAPAKAVLPGEHPPHFFSSVYNLAACEL